MKSRWCFPCDTLVQNSQGSSVDKTWELHLNSSSHVAANSRYYGPLEAHWDGVTIVATPTVNIHVEFRKMANLMRRHGYTNKLYSDGRVYVVSYSKGADAEKALMAKNMLEGIEVKTRPKFQYTSETEPVDLKKISVTPTGSWEQQALELASALRLPITRPQEAAALHFQITKLCNDVINTLNEYFPTVECFIFGSRVTGLAGIDSDVDLYVKLELRGTDFEGHDEGKELQIGILKKCDRLMRRRSHLFTNIQSVYQARIPVTHVLHLPTMIECDITCKNMLAVYNSRFLKFLMSLDERIFYFFFILKQWKKAWNLALSTYSFTMLAIFYLQTLPQPMLPPVKYLQDGLDCSIMENGWNCSFRDTPFEILNKMTLKDMVVGFFKFVPTVDFYVDVICPLLGNTLEKWRFMDPENLDPLLQPGVDMPQGFKLQYEKLMCIQDPFELNHNITKGVGIKGLEDLVARSVKVAELCDSNSKATLMDVINYDPKIKPQKQFGQPAKILYKEYFPNIELLREQPIRKLWFDEVTEVVRDIFTEILCCELVPQKTKEDSQSDSEGPPSKIQKFPSVSDVTTVTWNFSSPYNLTNGRKKCRPGVQKGTHFIREVLTSRLMLEKFYSDPGKIDEKLHLKFKVELTLFEKPTYALLQTFNNGSSPETFAGLGRFVHQELQNIVERSLLSWYKAELSSVNELESLEDQILMFQSDEQKKQLVSSVVPSNSSAASTTTDLNMQENPFLKAIEKHNAAL